MQCCKLLGLEITCPNLVLDVFHNKNMNPFTVKEQ